MSNKSSSQGFRMKPSHTFLKPLSSNVEATPTNKTLEQLLREEKEGKYDWLKKSTKTSSTTSGTPSVGANQANAHVNAKRGLVIRPNMRAQEDYL